MSLRVVLGATLVILLLAGSLAACGTTGNAEQQPPPSPTSASTPTPSTPAPAQTRVTTGGADDMREDPFLLGERIFKNEAAEGVGCSYCHDADGKGNIGPNIRSKSPGEIGFALKNVDVMSFIHLNEEEVEAVSEYLKWLATEP